jgi:hypothetical protein
MSADGMALMLSLPFVLILFPWIFLYVVSVHHFWLGEIIWNKLEVFIMIGSLIPLALLGRWLDEQKLEADGHR